jgi:hypothetical protein
MPVKFPSILTLNSPDVGATLDSNNLRGTTIQIDDFTSASLATIPAGTLTAPGKRRHGILVTTTGSINSPVRYYAYIQTSSGDINLSGSEWTDIINNWRQVTLGGLGTGDDVTLNNITSNNITSSGNISASGDLIINNISASGDIIATEGELFFSSSLSSDPSLKVVTIDDDPTSTTFGKLFHTGSFQLGGGGGSANLGNVQTNILPDNTNQRSIGSQTKKFKEIFAIDTFFGGIHEVNLETRGLDKMQEGTVLSLKDGMLQPCEKEADPLVMGIVSKNKNYPIILGAEPVLITGKIKEGDYIITSNVKGHGKGVNPRYIYNKKLFGKIIAQALESGKGKSYNIKAMIRKI